MTQPFTALSIRSEIEHTPRYPARLDRRDVDASRKGVFVVNAMDPVRLSGPGEQCERACSPPRPITVGNVVIPFAAVVMTCAQQAVCQFGFDERAAEINPFAFVAVGLGPDAVTAVALFECAEEDLATAVAEGSKNRAVGEEC